MKGTSMFDFRSFAAALLALTAAAQAQAISLVADGQWASFDVASDLSGNLGWIDLDSAEALSFSFTVPAGHVATLTVVDAGFAGDRYTVLDQGVVLGVTSAAVDSYPGNAYLDFGAALADTGYSRGVFLLAAGSHDIGGWMSRSALDDAGLALDSSVGGIRLTVSPVPEPATLVSMLAGLALIGLALKRRTR